MIRSSNPGDAAAIAKIYNHYVLHTCVTFEAEPVSPEKMALRLAEAQLAHPWLVHERNGSIEGYAYASRWSGRCSYRRSVETTVYLDAARVRKGIGSQLYAELVRSLRSTDLHVAIGGIALPNEASVALHEKLGFTKVAHFKEVGWKFSRWVDVGYWQLML